MTQVTHCRPACFPTRKPLAGLVPLALVLTVACDDGPLGVPFNPMPYVEVHAGGAHSCALSAEGEAVCWGRGSEGQLGQGAYSSSGYPVRVTGSATFTSLTTGHNHSCGLQADGQAACWGWGHYGQLGDGSRYTLSFPAPVQHVGSFTAITAGYYHTCALDEDGAAWCWGDNSQGQLGDGTTVAAPTPVAVQGEVIFSAIAAGGYHTCGVDTAGRIHCWGLNVDGQLGTGDESARLEPAPVAGGDVYTAVTAGGSHTCGLTAAGQAYCWGSTQYGEIGFGHVPPPGTPVVPVSAPTPVHQQQGAGTVFRTISAGLNFTCAVDTRGDAWCWGRGYEGQIGDNRLRVAATPQQVRLPANVRFLGITAGYMSHACAITEGPAAFCWGTANEGGIGPHTNMSTQPVRIAGPQ
ncbi:MAG TPA: hypothetical protein VK929_02460 [Longimicrobiales bacterium]|nr:hypothetical protein [Longimicrobiales bacterium]